MFVPNQHDFSWPRLVEIFGFSSIGSIKESEIICSPHSSNIRVVPFVVEVANRRRNQAGETRDALEQLDQTGQQPNIKK
jgi:hypothetical protein